MPIAVDQKDPESNSGSFTYYSACYKQTSLRLQNTRRADLEIHDPIAAYLLLPPSKLHLRVESRLQKRGKEENIDIISIRVDIESNNPTLYARFRVDGVVRRAGLEPATNRK